MDTSYAYAQSLDRADPLQHFRDKFIIPQRDGKDQVYFLGNSLGLQNSDTAKAISQVLQQWSHWGVEGFFKSDTPWLDFHDQLTAPLARIVGALPAEVVVMNQLSVNLHLLLASFYQPAGRKRKIVCEAKAFPSDQYILETHLRFRDIDPAEAIIEIQPLPGNDIIDDAAIIRLLHTQSDEIALVLLGGINYYSGQLFDLKAITQAAHAAGIVVGLDLAHAAGNVELQLHHWGVDFAAWCNYKYLNAGPGAIGAAFVHDRYHGRDDLPRLAGWWGYRKDTRFLMQPGFVPETGASGWQLSTPSPLQYACLAASLTIFEEAQFPRLLQKSRLMGDYFLFLFREMISQPGILLVTPEEQHRRGCQFSIRFGHHARALFDALEPAGIFADWREPDIIRVAPVPLYNRFTDIWHFADRISQML